MQHPCFDAFLFDLDGTLLHTLPDLTAVTNMALAEEGFPQKTENEILGLIGNGAFALAQQSAPSSATPEQVQRVVAAFRSFYIQFGLNLTREFDGVTETLCALKAAGKKLGIMSNKFEDGVQKVATHYFPNMFDTAHGEGPGVTRKPDPEGLLLCAAEMKLDPSRCAYVGDSVSDVHAAHAAGMYAIGVKWGYQTVEKICSGNPDALIASPAELLQFA